MENNDFNGDGYSDLLWRRDDGFYTIWDTTAAGLHQSTTFGQTVSSDWQVAGTGDFDGDGKSDILWRKADGQLTVWQSNGATFDAAFSQMVDTAWRVETVGDFNGDGRSDIFWRRDDGLVTTWLANAQGGFDDAADPVEFVAPGWHVEGAGDVDGDGRDDVVWQKDNRQLTVWTSDGSVPVKNDAWNQFPWGAGNRNGYVAEVGEFTGDAREDLFMPSFERYVALTIQESVGTEFDYYSGTSSGAMRFHSFVVGNFDRTGVDDVIEYAADVYGTADRIRVWAVGRTDDWQHDLVLTTLYESYISAEWSLVTL